MLTKITAIFLIAALLFPGAAVVAPGTPNSRMGQAEITATAPAGTMLTAEEAKEIALKHAGFTAGEVTGLRAEYDRDDGRPEYEVEFRQGDWEYDYTVHAETGAVLKHHKEYEPKRTTPPAVTEPAPTEPTPTEPVTKKLTAEEAKAIALNHAGFTADEVTGLRAEYDRDDGRPEYEVEFRVGRWEYEYEIHAETGKILSWDKDD